LRQQILNRHPGRAVLFYFDPRAPLFTIICFRCE